ncbi:MAG TPA: hypothetical protein VGD77_15045 [Gemmatimonadaceae bacterium]
MNVPSFGLRFAAAAVVIAILATLVHYRARNSDDVSQTYVLGWIVTSAAAAGCGWLALRHYPGWSPGGIGLTALVMALTSGATLRVGGRLVKTSGWQRLDPAGRVMALLIAETLAAAGFLMVFGAVIGLATVRGGF